MVVGSLNGGGGMVELEVWKVGVMGFRCMVLVVCGCGASLQVKSCMNYGSERERERERERQINMARNR